MKVKDEIVDDYDEAREDGELEDEGDEADNDEEDVIEQGIVEDFSHPPRNDNSTLGRLRTLFKNMVNEIIYIVEKGKSGSGRFLGIGNIKYIFV